MKSLRVFIYFNLRKKCYSVKALEGPDKGRVIAHRTLVALHGARFKVSEAGRQRVLRERQKNVHAGVEGYLPVSELEERIIQGWLAAPVRVAKYDPYKAGHFYDRDTEQPMQGPYNWAVCTKGGVHVPAPKAQLMNF